MTGKLFKFASGIIGLTLLLAIPTFVGAFNQSGSVSLSCTDGKVVISMNFNNNEQNDSLQVKAESSVFDDVIDMGTIGAGKSQQAAVATDQQSVPAGVVTFKVTKSGNENIDSLPVTFEALSCGNGSTPTPTPTIDPTAKPVLIIIGGITNLNGGTHSLTEFEVHVSGINVSPSDFPAPDYPLTVNLDPGVFNVTENVLPGYKLTMSGDCTGIILNGQQKTCHLDNEDLPQVTPTVTPTPTGEQGNNNCDNTNQSGTNDNNNCNQQNQNQGQDQTQNNNQNVNITLNQPTPQVLGSAKAVSLPSTGPTEVWALLSGIAPLGFFLRKITSK